MRKFFTLLVCLVLFIASIAQSPVKKRTTVIQIRCGAPLLPVKPLFVIDGIVKDRFDFKEIDPNNIERIEILKDAAAQTVYGWRAAKGVVVITTKNANQKAIYVKDFLNNEPLVGASIDLISMTNKRDTIHLIADSFGRAVSNKITDGIEYELSVSNTGYKSLRTGVNSKQINNSYTVFLTSEYKILEGVTVGANYAKANTKQELKKNRLNSNNVGLQGNLRCLIAGTRIKMLSEQKEKEVKPINFKVYPNPIIRAQKINIEFTSQNEETLSIRLFSLDGKLINTKEYNPYKGINRFEYYVDSRLASGIYAIQLFDRKNKLVKSEQLIIQ